MDLAGETERDSSEIMGVGVTHEREAEGSPSSELYLGAEGVGVTREGEGSPSSELNLGAEGILLESASSKKNRKKKEKKKEKKEAAATAKAMEEGNEEEGTGEASTKVAMHVRKKLAILAKIKEAEEKASREEEERLRKEEEEHRRQEELERIAEEARQRKIENRLRLKQEGKLLTDKQKAKARKLEVRRDQLLANADTTLFFAEKGKLSMKRPQYYRQKPTHSDNVKGDEIHKELLGDSMVNGNCTEMDVELVGSAITEEKLQVDSLEKNGMREYNLKEKKIMDNVKIMPTGAHYKEDVCTESLRSPICCIMGHVDAGKTKLLDYIRGSNVQEGEAGGITQQIGATYIPAESIHKKTKDLNADMKYKIPGLLVIDTPGHQSFSSLRYRGSGLCDIVILVVDIMHGLKPQTIESLNLLKMRNTEFVVALNKLDKLYGWKSYRNVPIKKAIKQQSVDVQNEFNIRLVQIITQFKEQGLNTELYDNNYEGHGETFSIVPTSATSGDGIPDLLFLLAQRTRETMVKQLTFSDEVQCTVLDVKAVEGHGTTIDVVLVNGFLHQGDQIVLCGLKEPIVTTIRALLTPPPMKELGDKGMYIHHKEIKAAKVVKISAQDLEHAISGANLYVVRLQDDLKTLKEKAMEDMKSITNRMDKNRDGVYAQASSLGSLEALLEYLKTEVKVPVRGIGIGPVHKKDVIAASAMLEKKQDYAAILAFDVRVTPEARKHADKLGVKIFTADVIYHLFNLFKSYIDDIMEEKKKEAAAEVVFPCRLKISSLSSIFNKKDPIIIAVDVLEGIAKIGTPICIPSRDFIDIGRIASIQKNNNRPVDHAKKGETVAIKVVSTNPEEQQKTYGRHFELKDELVSRLSRRSIDVLKAYYQGDLSYDDWQLVRKLKQVFRIT